MRADDGPSPMKSNCNCPVAGDSSSSPTPLVSKEDQGGELLSPESSSSELVLPWKEMARLGSIFGEQSALQCHEGRVSCAKRVPEEEGGET
jgi:hypothetical protein